MLRFLGVLVVSALFLGLPERAMADDVWEAPVEEKAKTSPVEQNEAALKAGKKVYEKRCLSCHGDLGKGDGRATAYMRVKPQDLSRKDVQEQSDGELFWKITTGRRPMPSFNKKLDDEERWQVLAYVRALAEQATAAEEETKETKD